ncbi:dethiobiotin synthase [bacterium]|nr:dethiobiotin synthase [bacterium]
MGKIYFVTGTDTGVGKTVLTSVLVRYLRDSGVKARAVKPFCSGGRDDARLLRRAQSNEPKLDDINPWHFRAPLAPVLAARMESKRVKGGQVLGFLREKAAACEVLLIEGAGGLMSPLAEGIDSRDLIAELQASPIVVCPNRLGAVNQVRLVLAALPGQRRQAARVVLMNNVRPNGVALSNPKLLSEYLRPDRLVTFPRINWPAVLTQKALPRQVRRQLQFLNLKSDSPN